MIILDNRINADYCVEVEMGMLGCDISQEIIEHWLTPFFSVLKENVSMAKIFAKIEIVEGIEQDYIYHDEKFFINANLSMKKLLYTLMSILRMLYKYMAFLMGYRNLHAACLKYKDNGILIRAERNQGKTTVLLNAIASGDFLLMANDQVMYNFNKNQLLGYPATVGIRQNCFDNEKQSKINESALWFIDDPFQSAPKPVVHIKDISGIYQCNIVEKADLKVIINYKKSMQKDELVISDMKTVLFPLSEMELPFNETYKEELLRNCKDSFNYYLGTDFARRDSEKYINKINIKQIDIKCGIDMIYEMLCEIKTILESRERYGNP